MGRFFTWVVLASALLITYEALTTAEYTNDKLISAELVPVPRLVGEQNDSNNRHLRTSQTIDENAEERALPKLNLLTKAKNFAATKLKFPKPVQFQIWLKAKWDPKRLYQHFGFTGKPLEWVEKQPNFAVYLEYSKFWNSKGGRYMR
ncbi:RxLR effector protein [Phytophthora megakarya]|uniref:RxLR effector protein n=1 Tax=Phytophthora megakarya TaxID=4795 RepID=A0A225WML1_9STRA|nr:RxLR effector protein [Phytophthora megakarya]